LPQRGEPDANGRFLADPITHWRGRDGRVWVQAVRKRLVARCRAAAVICGSDCRNPGFRSPPIGTPR
jgi:hypothetical protein